MPLQLEPATTDDLPAICALMNAAFRGSGPEAGWSTEAGYISGDRTSEALLRQDLEENPEAFLLLVRGESLQACVWLKPLSAHAWYLGSLTVDPSLQNAGLGRRLLEATEQWAVKRGGIRMQITVVNVRHALMEWYERRGYVPTGETRPFPYVDTRFGKPLREDLEFRVFEKELRLPAPAAAEGS